MPKEPFLTALKNRALLFDGGMGTTLYDKGVFVNQCYDHLNLTRPALIREVHNEFALSGADVLETNTFGANRFKLKKHGLEEDLAAINYSGAKLAREVAGDDLYVAGSIGPLGVRIEPWGPTSVEEAYNAFYEQAGALLDGKVDLFILETFSDLSEIQQALKAVRALCDLPVIACMTIREDGTSLYGTTPEIFATRLDDWGADVLGLNCSVGPPAMLDVLETIRPLTSKPIALLPNAGQPREVEGRNMYLATPEYMAVYARRFIQAGAQVVGGCCGTQPGHIKAMKSSIRMLHPEHMEVAVRKPAELKESQEPIPYEKRSRIAKKIANGETVTFVEITPPRSVNPDKVIESARKLHEFGVDGINIPDGPRAACRMSALSLSVILQQKVGIETVMHYCCRDRNLLGMQSDLMGAYALGVRNLIIITGDPPKMGDYPDATAVFDVDAIGLTNMVNRMNHGLDLGGYPIGEPTGFNIGVGLNPGAADLKREINRFEWKVDAGAEYVVTQPIFDPKVLLEFLPRIEHVRIPLIAGIWPLTSFRNAEFMNNEVPGASVPKEAMERMRKAQEKGKDFAREEGLAIAREALEALKPHVQGFQVSAPFGRVAYAMDVLEAL